MILQSDAQRTSEYLAVIPRVTGALHGITFKVAERDALQLEPNARAEAIFTQVGIQRSFRRP